MDDAALLARIKQHVALQASDHAEDVYLLAEAASAMRPTLEGGADLYLKAIARRLFINGMPAGIGLNPAQPHEPANGYAGGDVWRYCLMNDGVPATAIAYITEDMRRGGRWEPQFCNTRNELLVVAQHMKDKGIRRITMVAPDFHVLRAAVTWATAVTEVCPDDPIWCHFHEVSVPRGQITHSQGTQEGTWAEIMAAELAKISGPERYGNLISLADVLAYFRARDLACK